MTTRWEQSAGCNVFWGHYGKLGGVNRRSAVANRVVRCGGALLTECRGFLGLTRGAFQVQGCAGIDQKFAGRWNSAAGGALTMGCEVVDFCC